MASQRDQQVNSGQHLVLSAPNYLPSAVGSRHILAAEEEWACLYNSTEVHSAFKRSSNVTVGNLNENEKVQPQNLNSIKLSDNLEDPLACHRNWDGILCWPQTLAGEQASLPCFSHLNGVPYNTSGTARRRCDFDGSWENRTDYTECLPLPTSGQTDDSNLNITTGFYLGGYGLSLFFLIIALSIFVSFNFDNNGLFGVDRELRCLRNKIHTQLILTYILSDALWIITNFTSYQAHTSGSSHVSCVTFILLHYAHLTNFFMMFVEGLYLYVLVVQTFIAENIKLRVYCLIGWGIPLMVVVGWSIAKWLTQATVETNINDPEFSTASPTCLWLNVTVYDWIYKTPVIFVLGANIAFLSQIMWVLITKLRSAMNPETQQSRKAAKALLVLMPLLGITYVLILMGSKNNPIYEYIRALLISTQGFLVALLYCFLNGEVRIALRHRWNRWTVGPSFTCCGCEFEGRTGMQNMRDWSPRSRTESIRLYTPAGSTFRKRESSASDATSMTILGSGGGSAFNGSTYAQSITHLNKTRRFSTTTTLTNTGSPASTQRLITTNELNTLV